jgi:hypothetical protein
MAFPTTPVLEDFATANDPLSNSASWGAKWIGAAVFSELRAVSGEARRAIGETDWWCSSYWDASTFGPDTEVYATVSTLVSTRSYAVGARITTPGLSTTDGYLFQRTQVPDWRVYRMDDDSWTQLGATESSATYPLASGDKMGLEVIGSTIRGLRYASGAWSQVASRTDSTYTGAGYIGAAIGAGDSATAAIDDFGGGTIQQLIALGLATRSHTAFPFLLRVLVLLGLATRTTSAKVFSKQKIRAIGLATRTSTANAFSRLKIRSIGLATRTHSAKVFSKTKIRTLGLATRVATARPLAGRIIVALGVATRTAATFPWLIEGPLTGLRKVVSAGLNALTKTSLTPSVGLENQDQVDTPRLTKED